MKPIVRFDMFEWVSKKVFDKNEEIFELLHEKTIIRSMRFSSEFINSII